MRAKKVFYIIWDEFRGVEMIAHHGLSPKERKEMLKAWKERKNEVLALQKTVSTPSSQEPRETIS